MIRSYCIERLFIDKISINSQYKNTKNMTESINLILLISSYF